VKKKAKWIPTKLGLSKRSRKRGNQFSKLKPCRWGSQMKEKAVESKNLVVKEQERVVDFHDQGS